MAENFDPVLYALLKSSGGGGGGSNGYKGTVSTAEELPASANKGDMYIVTGENNALYVYDSGWIVSTISAITDNQIDALFT